MDFLVTILPLIVLFALLYFLMIRPQRQQQQERQAMLDHLKQDDEVITVGGIHGKIVKLNEDTVRLRIADGVEITINRGGIGQSEAASQRSEEQSEGD